MRLELDPLGCDGNRVPVNVDGVAAFSLWSTRLDWICAGEPLRVQILAAEALPLPESEPSEPAPGAIARIAASLAGTRAVAILHHPGRTFSPERIAFAEGARIFALGDEADERCWDAMLTRGVPVWGLRGKAVCTVDRADERSVIGALIYGNFHAEDGLSLDRIEETRTGVSWTCARDDAQAEVIARGGFPISRQAGASGRWTDRGDEGYVRISTRAGDSVAFTQPRFIAPSARPVPHAH